MSNLNKIFLLGRCTADPVIKKTESGTSVLNFGLATNHKYKDASGIEHDQPQFHDIVCWNALADLVSKYVKKGDQVMVEGMLQYSTFEDKNGSKHTRAKIACKNIQFLSNRKQETTEQPQYEDVPW